MVARGQDVRIWSIQRKQNRPRPYVVRWVVDGRQHNRSFRTKAEAERLRSRLLLAQEIGERFAAGTGEPETWAPSASDQTLYDWCRQWVAGEWEEWAPRTRDSEVEALSRFVPLVVGPGAPSPPDGLRRYLLSALRPGHDHGSDPVGTEFEVWLSRFVLSLGDLSESVLADVDRGLGLGLQGQALAPNTAVRYRRTARSCVQRAVDLKMIATSPWPPSPRGRSRRKSQRRTQAVDVKRLPSPATMLRIIEAMPSHQPGSRTFQAMTCVGYFAGLRPSEVIMLRAGALELPSNGWGRIDVVETDDGYDQAAEPKTGPRSVPIPPELVEVLTNWLIGLGDVEATSLLFRTRTGARPGLANWRRSLIRATEIVGHGPMSPYDCRHACATTWLGAGVALGEAAMRLGHSVETLVAHYVGALEGDDVYANRRISDALRSARSVG